MVSSERPQENGIRSAIFWRLCFRILFPLPHPNLQRVFSRWVIPCTVYHSAPPSFRTAPPDTMTVSTKAVNYQGRKESSGYPKCSRNVDSLFLDKSSMICVCSIFIPCLRLAVLAKGFHPNSKFCSEGLTSAAVDGEMLQVHFWGTQWHLVA